MRIKRALQKLLKDETKIAQLVQASFTAIDKDQSGAVDEEELYTVLRHAVVDTETEPLTLQDVKTAMTELDTLSDALITQDEFKGLVVSALQFLYQRETRNT